MTLRRFAVSFVALVSPLFAQEYDGKFVDHPNFDTVQEIAQRVAAESPKKLPKWLITKTPKLSVEFSVEFINAEKPLGAFDWPGKVSAGFKTAVDGKGWSARSLE